jgi:hypothetical protein
VRPCRKSQGRVMPPCCLAAPRQALHQIGAGLLTPGELGCLRGIDAGCRRHPPRAPWLGSRPQEQRVQAGQPHPAFTRKPRWRIGPARVGAEASKGSTGNSTAWQPVDSMLRRIGSGWIMDWPAHQVPVPNSPVGLEFKGTAPQVLPKPQAGALGEVVPEPVASGDEAGPWRKRTRSDPTTSSQELL